MPDNEERPGNEETLEGAASEGSAPSSSSPDEETNPSPPVTPPDEEGANADPEPDPPESDGADTGDANDNADDGDHGDISLGATPEKGTTATVGEGRKRQLKELYEVLPYGLIPLQERIEYEKEYAEAKKAAELPDADQEAIDAFAEMETPTVYATRNIRKRLEYEEEYAEARFAAAQPGADQDTLDRFAKMEPPAKSWLYKKAGRGAIGNGEFGPIFDRRHFERRRRNVEKFCRHGLIRPVTPDGEVIEGFTPEAHSWRAARQRNREADRRVKVAKEKTERDAARAAQARSDAMPTRNPPPITVDDAIEADASAPHAVGSVDARPIPGEDEE